MNGAPTCRMHGSSAKQVRAKAKRRLALGELEGERLRLGVPVEVGNAEAMIEMVWEAAGNVAFYRGLVQQLRTGEALVEGYDDEDILDAMASIGMGKTVARSRKGQIADRVDPSNWRAEPHVLVRMYNEERDRLVKYAKLCRDAGVEEHRIALAESQGQMLFEAVRSFLAALTASLIAAGLAQTVVKRVMTTEAPSMLAASLRVLDGP